MPPPRGLPNPSPEGRSYGEGLPNPRPKPGPPPDLIGPPPPKPRLLIGPPPPYPSALYRLSSYSSGFSLRLFAFRASSFVALKSSIYLCPMLALSLLGASVTASSSTNTQYPSPLGRRLLSLQISTPFSATASPESRKLQNSI